MVKTVPFEAAWTGESDCLNCKLRNSVLFAGLEEKDFQSIHQPINQVVYPAGSLLYRAGEKADNLYTIRRGLVKLVQYLPDGTQRIVRLLKSTDVTGLEGLLGNKYQHDAIVMQATEVCTLPVTVVNQLSEQNPKLEHELMARWQQALNEADLWITQLSTGSAKQRIARLILHLACVDNDNDCELFSREDMGAMLGITTETASRTIADFKRQGLITGIEGNRYQVNDIKLREVAENG